MNKKVLTISTGMLLSTALAFAINPQDLKVATEVTSGNNYFVVADLNDNKKVDAGDFVLRMDVDPNDATKITYANTKSVGNTNFEDKGIYFKIIATPNTGKADHYLYSLYGNEAKAYVATTDNSNTLVTTIEDTEKGVGNLWAFNDGTASYNIAEYTEAAFLNSNVQGNYNLVIGDGYVLTQGSASGVSKILLCEAQRSVSDEDLNEFFNDKGFNLGVKYDADNGELKENIFSGEEGKGRIWAFQITDPAGYTISKAGPNGKDLIIPAGMYFFTDRQLKSGVQPSTSMNADDIDWLASTLIAVSPKETVETTVDNRAEGQGFQLVEVKGSDFIFVDNTSEFKVGDTPIYNACFIVEDNASNNANYPYAIALEKFYYQKNNKETDDEKLSEADVYLGVLAFDAEDMQYLTTIPGSISDAQHIFRFDNSAAIDGRDLLYSEKKAAVYTIKFVEGTADDKYLIGKYLTVGNKGNDFVWVAKGSALTNTSYPSFQYTITAVEDADPTDDNEIYQLVTFTNRETNESFRTMLFKEEGTDRYSLAIDKVNGVSSSTFEVNPVKVNSNTYAVNAQSPRWMDENIIVELKKVETVDEYAGFLNVDNESVRTIRFARDKNDTSYKWYAGVAVDRNGNIIEDLTDGRYDYFVEDVYEAAQWQLIKKDEPETIARTYVYNNTTTKDVDDVANGDKVSAYQYILRYVDNGTPSNYFLTDWVVSGDVTLNSNPIFERFDEGDVKYQTLISNSVQTFYVKENADGSISLFDTTGAFSNAGAGTKVTVADKIIAVNAEIDQNNGSAYYVNGSNRDDLYAYTSDDYNLKTYLDGEAPNISLEGEEGHVTLQNGTASLTGDYVSVNDENEGIVIDESSDVLYLHVTDKDAVVPSFYISKGLGEGSNAESERLFMYNPVDSIDYPVNMDYDPNYQLAKKVTKVIFKTGSLNASRDTMTTSLKGEVKEVAMKADQESTWGGLNRFKFQIIETADRDGLYNIRQINGSEDNKTVYVASNNEKLYFTNDKDLAMAVAVERVEAPTANESVSATEVKVVAYDGAINIKNAAGKNVVVSTILGQIVANEVLTSDNATISVPAGIAIVSVDGEEAVKVSVR